MSKWNLITSAKHCSTICCRSFRPLVFYETLDRNHRTLATEPYPKFARAFKSFRLAHFVFRTPLNIQFRSISTAKIDLLDTSSWCATHAAMQSRHPQKHGTAKSQTRVSLLCLTKYIKIPKKNGHTYMKFVRLCSVARACNRWRLKQALSRILKKIEIWISKDILKHLGRFAKPGDSGIVFVAKPSKQELKRLLRSAPLRLEDIATCDLPFVNTKKTNVSETKKKRSKSGPEDCDELWLLVFTETSSAVQSALYFFYSIPASRNQIRCFAQN